MNRPFHPVSSSPRYDEDAYAWSLAQARLIRERRFDAVDWENIAEEIESVGRSERRSLHSNLTQLLLHMMKWDAQPDRRGRSWLISIENHRADAQRDLRDNPSIKAILPELYDDALVDARRRASLETNIPAHVFADMGYTIDEAFGRPHMLPGDA